MLCTLFWTCFTHCDGVARVLSNIVYLENDMVLLLWQGGINSDNFLFLDQVMSPDPRNRFFLFSSFFSPFILWDFILFSSWRLSSGGVCSFGTTTLPIFLTWVCQFLWFIKKYDVLSAMAGCWFYIESKAVWFVIIFFLCDFIMSLTFRDIMISWIDYFLYIPFQWKS